MFHGTPSKNIPSILCHGLDLKYAKPFIRQREGIYVAKYCCISHGYTQPPIHTILVCSILIRRDGRDHFKLQHNHGPWGYVLTDNSKIYVSHLIQLSPNMQTRPNVHYRVRCYYCLTCLQPYYKKHTCNR